MAAKVIQAPSSKNSETQPGMSHVFDVGPTGQLCSPITMGYGDTHTEAVSDIRDTTVLRLYSVKAATYISILWIRTRSHAGCILKSFSTVVRLPG